MTKIEFVKQLLGERDLSPKNSEASAFAPSNIALCKYWGKRCQTLNLPQTSSLSISLADHGATTQIRVSDRDRFMLNGVPQAADSQFSKRLSSFLDLFRYQKNLYFDVLSESNIPVAAGLASSACGFAALVKALDQLFALELPDISLSMLARLGSGSAARSLWHGFVEWHAGQREDGMDSYAEPIATEWPEFCIGLLILSASEKPLSSRVAMQRTIETSAFYAAWPDKVANDMDLLKQAIDSHDFAALGRVAENNALAMHATMHTALPPVCYTLPETLAMMHQVWQLRSQGIDVFFTQDAGPNLKLLFLQKDLALVREVFPDLCLVNPFL